MDSGILEGDTVAGAFDSMIAKLIVTGATRQQAWSAPAAPSTSSSSRACPPSRLPPRGRLDEAFAPADPHETFSVHTRWIETEFVNTIEPYAGAAADAPEADERQTVVVEVGGKRLEVSCRPALPRPRRRRTAARRRRDARGRQAGAAASGDSLTAPMQGTIVKIAVEEGDVVAEGDLVVVLEAMKMEQPITAHKAGAVPALAAEVGATVTNGAVLCEIKDA